MFSGICPWSPCDRASPSASVSTLGSMTSRPRAGRGARCGPQAPHLNAAADSTRAGGGKGRLGGGYSPVRGLAGVCFRLLSRAARPDPCAPSSPAAPESLASCEETGVWRPGGDGARARGLGEGGAAWGADPGAQRGRRGEVPPRGRCRCCGTARRLPPPLPRPPPAQQGLPSLQASPPLPAPAASRSLSSADCEVAASSPASLPPPACPGTALSSPAGDGAGRKGAEEEKGGRQDREGTLGWGTLTATGDAGSGLRSDPAASQ